MRALSILILLAIVAGCGPKRVWMKPGVNDATDRAATQATCEDVVHADVHGFGIAADIAESVVFEQCMREHGYDLVTVE